MDKDLFGICPITTAQKILTGKWTLLIIHLLREETLRFNELHRELPNLTQSTLTKQLRFMEENSLVIRTVYRQIPPKVEYSLSEMGRNFTPVMEALEAWGNQYINYLKDKE